MVYRFQHPPGTSPTYTGLSTTRPGWPHAAIRHGSAPRGFRPWSVPCHCYVGARFGTPGAESGSGVIKHVREETGRRERKQTRGLSPRGLAVNSSYCPLNKRPTFSVRSTFTPRAEGSNHNHKRRNSRSGICGAGSESPKSFSAPVREKTVQKRQQTDMSRASCFNCLEGDGRGPAFATR